MKSHPSTETSRTCHVPVAVVVTHNRREMLMRCLDSLEGQTMPCDILVIDNASTDGTREAVEGYAWGRVSYINTGANLGGAGGFAFGINAAINAGAEKIWIMDDDVIPSSDALKGLCEAEGAMPDEYGWLSSKCVMQDGRICPMNLQRATPYRKIGVQSLNGGDAPVLSQMASFVSLFFDARTVRRFGLPLADFFIWCDDLEWTRRVSRELPCYTVPTSVVMHAITGSAASNIALDAPERITRYFYAFRNEFFVYRREGPCGIAYYAAKCAFNFMRLILFARNRRMTRLRTLFSGMAAGLTFRPRSTTPPVR